jgi:hypothetical protein
MNLSTAKALFGEQRVEDVVTVNPLVMAANKLFGQGARIVQDYRADAVDYVFDKKLSFHSECNCLQALLKKLGIYPLCPVCGTPMPFSGNFRTTTFEWQHCGTTVSIRLDEDAVHVTFPEGKENK